MYKVFIYMYIYKSKTDCSQIYMISAKKGPQMIALTSSNIHSHTSHAQPQTQCTDSAQTDADMWRGTSRT